jgi:methyltransferase (TIGR00027 family)
MDRQPQYSPRRDRSRDIDQSATNMTRTDNDTWDLASSVGATATMVATARAVASREPNAIISDPFAAPLVKAVGIDALNQLVDGDIAPAGIGEKAELSLQPVIQSFAVRTRFFDEFFISAADAGVRQAVIVASGLDSRAYRLSWPAGSIVYEIDQPAVVEFKSRALSQLGAKPTATRRPVPVDLREDWPAALRDNVFDETQPTAWSVEGLLMYLPPDAQNRLFDNITALSAPGSRVATEYQPDAAAALKQRKAFDRKWRARGLDVDTTRLVYQGDRSALTDYLVERGWRITTQSRADLFETYGLTAPEENAPMLDTVAVTAVLK